MSSEEKLKDLAISFPEDFDEEIEYLVMDEDGGRFCKDVMSVKFFTENLNSVSVSFRFVWFKGLRFMLCTDRDQSKEKWNRRGYISYGPSISKGRLLYGNLMVIGCENEGARIRSLNDLEKKVLWSCMKCLSVNYGTDEKTDIRIIFRLCYAEDRPNMDSLIVVDDEDDLYDEEIPPIEY